MNQLMLLRLTKIHRKMTGIYAPILLHDLGCCPRDGSQKDRASMPPRAVPAQEYTNHRGEGIPTGRSMRNEGCGHKGVWGVRCQIGA
jgi:hypothetical protein